jgi:hypothetical protein
MEPESGTAKAVQFEWYRGYFMSPSQSETGIFVFPRSRGAAGGALRAQTIFRKEKYK